MIVPDPITIKERKRGRALFCFNAAFWGLGNGLVSTSLIIYTIQTLAQGKVERAMIGIAISWVIAAPRLVGILRIFTPNIIDRLGSYRRVCLVGYLCSPLILLLLPNLLPLLQRWDADRINLAFWIVGAIWAVYHLIEYFASIALWSWIGDSLHSRIRARFLARREKFMITGQFVGMLTAGLYTWLLLPNVAAIFPQENPVESQLRVYMAPALVGIVFLLAAPLPLLSAPESRKTDSEPFFRRLRQLLAPLRSREFIPLILFGCWIQIANGLVQGAQSLFLIQTLGITMLFNLFLQSGTRIGQIALTGTIGRAIDRVGTGSVMTLSLVIVSFGQLCYVGMGQNHWFCAVFAAMFWIFWVGLNIAMANLSISLSPPEQRSSWLALYYTATTLTFGISTLIGGFLLDCFRQSTTLFSFWNISFSYFTLIFVLTAIFRLLGVLFLLFIPKTLRAVPSSDH